MLERLKNALAKALKNAARWREVREERTQQRHHARAVRNHKRAERKRETAHRERIEKELAAWSKKRPLQDAPPEEWKAWETRWFNLKSSFRDSQHRINQLHEEIDDAATKYDRLSRKVAHAEKRVRFFVVVRLPHVRARIRKAQAASGLSATGSRRVMIEGRYCAEHLAYRIVAARAAGWSDPLNSAWRDPDYSEQLCYGICGQPVCPGRCAGRGSAHSQTNYPLGAIDVSNPSKFAAIMRALSGRIPGYVAYNALGSADPWHMSYNGR